MTLLKKILSDRRFHRLAGIGLVMGVGMVLVAWKMEIDGEIPKSRWKQAESYLKENSWLLFRGLVILPGLPVPTSAPLFLAGTLCGGTGHWLPARSACWRWR